jgi:subtilisin family serine protease
MLAAPGAELAVAQLGGAYVAARGTSFAAPLVAGLLAEALQEPGPAAAAAALARVADTAVDLGVPGRDPVYGLGLVGERARVAPERVQAKAR